MDDVMDQRARAALSRIDRAVSRIDSALEAEPARASETAELERLRAAHQLLRRRVEAAIGEIDALSGAGEPS